MTDRSPILFTTFSGSAPKNFCMALVVRIIAQFKVLTENGGADLQNRSVLHAGEQAAWPENGVRYQLRRHRPVRGHKSGIPASCPSESSDCVRVAGHLDAMARGGAVHENSGKSPPSRESGNPPLGLVQCLKLQSKTSERTFPNLLALAAQSEPRAVTATRCRFAAQP